MNGIRPLLTPDAAEIYNAVIALVARSGFYSDDDMQMALDALRVAAAWNEHDNPIDAKGVRDICAVLERIQQESKL